MGVGRPTNATSQKPPRVHEPSNEAGLAAISVLRPLLQEPRPRLAPGAQAVTAPISGAAGPREPRARGATPPPRAAFTCRGRRRRSDARNWDSRGGRPSARAPPRELHTLGPLSPAACTCARRDGDAKRRTARETSRIPSPGVFFAAAARPLGATAPAHERGSRVPRPNRSTFPFELYFPDGVAGRRPTVSEKGQSR